jgi:hypothetical protein
MPRKIPLTKAARDYLCRALYAKATAAVHEHHKPAQDRLAKECLESVYGPTCLSSFAAAPEGWLPKVEHIGITGEKGGCIRLNLIECIPVPCAVWATRFTVADADLFARCQAAEVSYNEALREARLVEEEAKKALAAIRSLEALQEEWPEAYGLLPAEYKGSPNLPAHPLVYVKARFAALCDAMRQDVASADADADAILETTSN